MKTENERTLESDQEWLAALKRERAAYVAAGDLDRAGQVDDQIARLGLEPTERPSRKQAGSRLRGTGKQTRAAKEGDS